MPIGALESPRHKGTRLATKCCAFVCLPPSDAILQCSERDQDAARKIDALEIAGMILRELCPTANRARRTVDPCGGLRDGKRNGVEMVGHGSPLSARVWPCRRFVGEPPEARQGQYAQRPVCVNKSFIRRCLWAYAQLLYPLPIRIQHAATTPTMSHVRRGHEGCACAAQCGVVRLGTSHEG
jgi:hypothetical protein